MIDIEDPLELERYLRTRGYLAAGQALEAEVLRGGVSNRTVLVRLPGGACWVLKQALEQLRVKVAWFSDPARIEREALGLRWMSVLAPAGAAPALVFEDRDQHIVGMQAVPAPHHNWKTLLLRGEVDEEHVRRFARLLSTIHRRAAELAAELAVVFGDRTFFETLRLEPYYRYTASQLPRAAAFLHALIEETLASRHTLVHGDYSPKNVLVHGGRLVLLDYEVIHWGDPAFDAGFSMAHLLSKAHHVADRRGAFVQAAQVYWRTYADGVAGRFGDLEARAVRHTLACLLARVDGRSPLEYLDDEERGRQRDAACALIDHLPPRMPDLIDRFTVTLR